jgi:hypothetical protein
LYPMVELLERVALRFEREESLGSAHLWVRRPRLAVEPILVRIRLILVG